MGHNCAASFGRMFGFKFGCAGYYLLLMIICNVKWNYNLSNSTSFCGSFQHLHCNTFIVALLCEMGAETQKDPIQCLKQKQHIHFLYTLCWDSSHCVSSTTDENSNKSKVLLCLEICYRSVTVLETWIFVFCI